MCRSVNAKYPKLTRLASSLLDKNKAESEQTVEANQTKVDTRRNKKVDTNYNNKTYANMNRPRYQTSLRASDAEQAITKKLPLESPVNIGMQKGKTWGHI